MAEVKNVKINVDTKQAVDAMENLSKATNDVSKSFEEVYGDLQPLTTRMGEAEDRLYELANAGKTATQEYQDLLTTVGNYRKVQIQTDMAVDAAAGTMSTKLGGALGGATAGFQLVQGAMGAFGSESAKVEEALLKVQSAMAIADGVRGFREAIPSIKSFGAAMKAAIGSTGIGLLVVALGTLAAYWDDIKAAVGGVSEEQSKLNAKTDANVLAQQAKYDTISGQDNILKLQGKSEQDILKIKKAQINAVITATEAQLVQQESTKKAQVAAAKRNNEILQGIITFLTAPLQLLLKTVDMVGSALGKDFGLQKGFTKGLANLVFDPEETAAEADKTIDETKKKLATLKNEAAGFEIALQQQSDKSSKTAKDKTESNNDLIGKANAEAKKLALEQQQQLDAKLEEIAEQNYLKTLSDQEKELLAVQDKYFELETLAKGNAEALNDIEIAKLNEQNDINLKYQNIAYEQDKAAKAKQKEADDKAAKDKEDAEKTLVATLAAIRESDFNNISAGINLVKNLFENNKKIQAAALIAENAVGIAKTIISTKAANQAARAQGTALAIATGGASALAAEALVLRNNIGAGISIAAQIAATAKGVSALGGGGGASPSGGGSLSEGGGAGGITPNFNVVGNSGMNQLAQIQQTPVQAYVVSGEVTSAQALDRNRIKNATL
jgi:actin-related protein